MPDLHPSSSRDLKQNQPQIRTLTPMGKEYVPEILSVRTATWLIPSTPNTPRNKGRRRKPKPIFPQRSTQTKRWEHGSIWTKRGRGYYVVARSYYMLVKSCLLGLVLPFKTALIWKNKIIIFNTHFSWAFTLNQSKAIEYIYTVHIIWNLQFCMFFCIYSSLKAAVVLPVRWLVNLRVNCCNLLSGWNSI